MDLKNKAAIIRTGHATETKGKFSQQRDVFSDVTLDKHINWFPLSEKQCKEKYNQLGTLHSLNFFSYMHICHVVKDLILVSVGLFFISVTEFPEFSEDRHRFYPCDQRYSLLYMSCCSPGP